MPGGSRRALLIATSAYQDAKFQRLRAPAEDVAALAEVLGDPDIGGFEVRTLLDQQSWEVSEEIEEHFADRTRDDLLVLYFSCHGVKDANGRLYFATTNTKFDRLGSTGISSTWVNDQLDRSLSRRVVLLLDCCYSGAYARGLAPRADQSVQVVERFQGRGRAVITASDAMEYAYEGDDLSHEAGQPSVFTSALVRGLRTGEADRDGDGQIALGELHGYVYDQVREVTPNQTPTMSAHGLQGELYLAKNPHPPPPPVEPVPLPFELRQALESELGWQREGAVSGLKRLLDSDRPGLALSGRNALERLAADDDAHVRAAAQGVLASLVPVAPAPEVARARAAGPPDLGRESREAEDPPGWATARGAATTRPDVPPAPGADARAPDPWTVRVPVAVGAFGLALTAFSLVRYEARPLQALVTLMHAALAVGGAWWVTRSPRPASRFAGSGLIVAVGLTLLFGSVKLLTEVRSYPEYPIRFDLVFVVSALSLSVGAMAAMYSIRRSAHLGWQPRTLGLTVVLALFSATVSVLEGRSVLAFSLSYGPDSMVAGVALAAPAVVVSTLLRGARPDRFASVALGGWVLLWLTDTLAFDAKAEWDSSGYTIVVQALAFGAITVIGVYQALRDRPEGT